MGLAFSRISLTQAWPPAPTLTEHNIPSQKGKVFIVTGGYAGVGEALCKILYHAGGRVYIAGRSAEKAEAAISRIKSSPPPSSNTSTTTSYLSEKAGGVINITEEEEEEEKEGELIFLQLDLSDLRTIKPFVEEFSRREQALHVLFNNAGIAIPPKGSLSAQGHPLTIATNVLGPHLLTELLLPRLRNNTTAASRVVWTSSILDQLRTQRNPTCQDLTRTHTDPMTNYSQSKLGNWLLASELGARETANGIISVTQNPGNLKTGLVAQFPSFLEFLMRPFLHDSKFGAYTALWAGLAPDLTLQDSGCYILPWGRKCWGPREDLIMAVKRKELGGRGVAAEYREWCDEQIRAYL